MQHSLSYLHRYMQQYYNVSGCRKHQFCSNVALMYGWAKDNFSSTHQLETGSCPDQFGKRQRLFQYNSEDRNMSHYRREISKYALR